MGLGASSPSLSGRTFRNLVFGHDTELVQLPWVNDRCGLCEPEPSRLIGVHTMYELYHFADRRETTGLRRTPN